MELSAENIRLMRQYMGNRWFRLSCGLLYHIIDARGQKIPFVPYPHQEEFYHKMWWQNLILKSRQLGFTTFIQLFILDDTLHSQSINSAVIAHKREDAGKFFNGKIKFALYSMPDFMLEQTEIVAADKNTLTFNNAAKGEKPLLSNIWVTTSARSGTIQNLHLSEFGHLCTYNPSKAKEVIAGTLNAMHAGSRVFIESTAEGPIGEFYEWSTKAQEIQRKGSELSRFDRRFFFFPWHKDSRNAEPPTKDYEFSDGMLQYFKKLEDVHQLKLTVPQRFWYAKKAEEQGRLMKKEQPTTAEEAFEAIIEGAVYGVELERMYEQNRLKDVPYDPELPTYTIWDLGTSKGNAMAICFVQFDGFYYRYIDFYYKEFGDLEEACKAVTDKEYHYDKHFGPWDISISDVAMSGGKTRADMAAEYGVEFEMERGDNGKYKSVIARTSPVDRYEQGRQHMARCVFDVDGTKDRYHREMGREVYTPGLIKSLTNYRHEYDEALKMFSKEPIHDWASNLADAYGYSAQASVYMRTTMNRRGRGSRGRRIKLDRSRPRAAA